MKSKAIVVSGIAASIAVAVAVSPVHAAILKISENLGITAPSIAASPQPEVSTTDPQNNTAPSFFTDVDPTFWGYANIKWGKDRKILDGYQDGTFRPNEKVTEAEFLKMLVTSSTDPKTAADSSDWSAAYYDAAKRLGWKPKGLTASEVKNKPIIRPNIAHLLINAAGEDHEDDNINIQKVLDLGLSQGKTDASIAGFAGKDILTRAEAITFIKNLKEKLIEAKAVTDSSSAPVPSSTPQADKPLSPVMQDIMNTLNEHNGSTYTAEKDSNGNIIITDPKTKQNPLGRVQISEGSYNDKSSVLISFPYMGMKEEGWKIENAYAAIQKYIGDFKMTQNEFRSIFDHQLQTNIIQLDNATLSVNSDPNRIFILNVMKK